MELITKFENRCISPDKFYWSSEAQPEHIYDWATSLGYEIYKKNSDNDIMFWFKIIDGVYIIVRFVLTDSCIKIAGTKYNTKNEVVTDIKPLSILDSLMGKENVLQRQLVVLKVRKFDGDFK